jgi:small conductance mechanosensitive channel
MKEAQMKAKMSSVYRLMIFIITILSSNKAQAQEALNTTIGGLKEMATNQIDTAKNLVNMIIEFLIKYGFQVLGGIIVLIAGWMLAKFVAKLITKQLEKHKVDVTVSKFITSGVKLMIMTFAVIVALGKFGIEIAPLIAGISVAGFGLTFALQGTLANFAAGASLIFSKPFKVGDIIEVAQVVGEVVDIKLPRTELKTIDGNSIVIPNSHIIGQIITNYSENKQVDIKVGVSYKADIKKAIETLREVIKNEPQVVKTKEPKIGIAEFGDSSVNLYARLWCQQDHYWDVLFSINKNIFEEFNKKGIEIPFPQRDVHIFQAK